MNRTASAHRSDDRLPRAAAYLGVAVFAWLSWAAVIAVAMLLWRLV